VDNEHGHVEHDGDDDKTENTSKEVFKPKALELGSVVMRKILWDRELYGSDILGIT
jgi:hypothetical protein